MRSKLQAIVRFKKFALAALIVLLAVLGVLTVAVKLSRLVSDSGTQGALAITFLHGVTQAWWDGSAVYADHRSGVVYPPATWVLLGPVFARTTLEVARWGWAGASLVALAALGAACARAVRETGRLPVACAWLAPFSMPALGDALGIGALITVVLPLAVWSVLLASGPRPTWTTDVAAAAMFDVALVDPSLALPFAGPLLVWPGRIRPAGLALAGYVVVTLLAAWVHPGSFMTDAGLWIEHIQRQGGHGYGNLQDWLFQSPWNDWFVPLSVTAFVALGLLVWLGRHGDKWLLLGISAIASRLWMAPRIDYDALLIIPLMATARLASADGIPRRVVVSARAMLLPLTMVLWVPLQFHFAGSTVGPWTVTTSGVSLFDAAHLVAILLTLCVLAGGTIVTRHGGHAQ